MTTSFQLHTTLSSKALNSLTTAVTHDENGRPFEAISAYDQAIGHLSTYVTVFAPSSSSFARLTITEKTIVRDTLPTFQKHLHNARNRRLALRHDSTKSAMLPTRHLPTTTPTSASQLLSRTAPPILSGTVVPRRFITPGSKTIKPSNPAPATASPTAAVGASAAFPADHPLRKAIEAEILEASPDVSWDDIYGLQGVKSALQEMVILPSLRPDLYTGLRAPGRGILLFGPPGTGKTLIARAVATNVQATFFSISAASLNSKFHGESERLVRALFAIARERQPSFIFIDEVDAILGARGDSEHEASRRLKTEFMAQFDGAGGQDNKVYVMAASNRPQDLDDAVRRRLDRRIYVPLPDEAGRLVFLKQITAKNDHVKWSLSNHELGVLAGLMTYFSGSDIKAACREAALMPLRELGTRVGDVRVEDVRACNMRDFERALDIVRPSSSLEQIAELEQWNKEFGSESKQKGGRANSGSRPGGGGGGARLNGGYSLRSQSETGRSVSDGHRRKANGANGMRNMFGGRPRQK